MVITMAKPRGPISFFPKMSFQVCNPDIYGVFFCGRGDLVTCGDLDENSGPHCSGCSLKNCVSCIDTRIHLDHLTGKILKIQWVSFPSNNTPGTAGGPGGRDRTLAVAKNRAKITFFSGGKKNCLK